MIVEEQLLAKFRREIFRATMSPKKAEELIIALVDTDWMEVGRSEDETRKVDCDGCGKRFLYRVCIHFPDPDSPRKGEKEEHLCPACRHAVLEGFTLKCHNCRRCYVSHDFREYRKRNWRHFTSQCPNCIQALREQAQQRLIGPCIFCEEDCSLSHAGIQVCKDCRERYGIDDKSIRAEYQKVYSHGYRSRDVGAEVSLTLDQWFLTLRDFDWHCAYCLVHPYETLDHFIPVCKMGATTMANCIPSCDACNKLKGQRHPDIVTAIPQEALQRVRDYLQTRN